MTFPLRLLITRRARYVSSCHLVELTAHEVTSLVWIRSRTFLCDGLIIIIIIITAEMLIIQTCPRSLKHNTEAFSQIPFYDLGFFSLVVLTWL